MRVLRLMRTTTIFLACLTLAGCCHRRAAQSKSLGCPTGNCPPPPGAFSSPPPAYPSVPPPPGPSASIPPGSIPQGSIPPGGFAPNGTSPAGGIPGLPPPPNSAPPGAPLERAAPPGPSSSALPPGPADVRDRVGYRWEPGDLPPPPKEEAKGPAKGDAKNEPPVDDRVVLLPPEFDEKAPKAKKDSIRLYPPEPTKDAPTGTLPVGIPDFANVRDQVSVGRRPALDEGLDWLEKNRYKTVLHLRLPGENGDADRKQAEKRGLRYVSIEANPRLLTRETVDEFLRIVGDRSEQPLFVYDQTGAVAGAMFYLVFRTVDQDSPEVAQVRASRLGLQPDRSDIHREMWQAVQAYLRDR